MPVRIYKDDDIDQPSEDGKTRYQDKNQGIYRFNSNWSIDIPPNSNAYETFKFKKGQDVYGIPQPNGTIFFIEDEEDIFAPSNVLTRVANQGAYIFNTNYSVNIYTDIIKFKKGQRVEYGIPQSNGTILFIYEDEDIFVPASVLTKDKKKNEEPIVYDKWHKNPKIVYPILITTFIAFAIGSLVYWKYKKATKAI